MTTPDDHLLTDVGAFELGAVDENGVWRDDTSVRSRPVVSQQTDKHQHEADDRQRDRPRLDQQEDQHHPGHAHDHADHDQQSGDTRSELRHKSTVGSTAGSASFADDQREIQG